MKADTKADLSVIKVLSFDLDDTFWDCAPAIDNAERALYAWFEQVTPKIASAHSPASLEQFRAEVRVRHVALQGCVTAMRRQGLKELLVHYDYPEEWVDEAFDVFYRARSEVQLYPLVHDLLQMTKERFQVAAITNGNASLEQIGISGYFDKVYAADLELKAKPHSDMFDRCCSHFGVSAHQVLHIGDNAVTDVQGGLQAGMQTLWFNQAGEPWPHTPPGPHFEARNIDELLKLLSNG